MNTKQIHALAKPLAKDIGGHVPMLGRGVPSHVYQEAHNRSWNAECMARYLAQHLAAPLDQRKLLLNLCGMRALARDLT